MTVSSKLSSTGSLNVLFITKEAWRIFYCNNLHEVQTTCFLIYFINLSIYQFFINILVPSCCVQSNKTPAKSEVYLWPKKKEFSVFPVKLLSDCSLQWVTRVRRWWEVWDLTCSCLRLLLFPITDSPDCILTVLTARARNCINCVFFFFSLCCSHFWKQWEEIIVIQFKAPPL